MYEGEKKPTNEEVNRSNLGIFKKIFGVEEL